MNWKRSLWTSGVVCFVYGILMELAQGFLTTYRSMDLKDAIANTTGIVFAVITKDIQIALIAPAIVAGAIGLFFTLKKS